MVTVLLWGRFDITGHVSLVYGQNDYTSWHPATQNKLIDDLAPVPGAFVDGRNDHNNHPNGPSHTLRVTGFDEVAMLARHRQLKADAASGRLHYSLGYNNCSRIAADVLSHGHHEGIHFFTHINVVLHRVFDHRAKRVQYNLPELVQDAAKGYGAAVARGAAAAARVHPFVKAAMGLTVMSEALVWTPRDVVELASMYENGI